MSSSKVLKTFGIYLRIRQICVHWKLIHQKYGGYKVLKLEIRLRNVMQWVCIASTVFDFVILCLKISFQIITSTSGSCLLGTADLPFWILRTLHFWVIMWFLNWFALPNRHKQLQLLIAQGELKLAIISKVDLKSVFIELGLWKGHFVFLFLHN